MLQSTRICGRIAAFLFPLMPVPCLVCGGRFSVSGWGGSGYAVVALQHADHLDGIKAHGFADLHKRDQSTGFPVGNGSKADVNPLRKLGGVHQFGGMVLSVSFHVISSEVSLSNALITT